MTTLIRDLIDITYGEAVRGSATAISTHVKDGRLMSLEAWLERFGPRIPDRSGASTD